MPFFKQLWLIHVPAAAVRHEQRTLIMVVGCKTCLDFYIKYIVLLPEFIFKILRKLINYIVYF